MLCTGALKKKLGLGFLIFNRCPPAGLSLYPLLDVTVLSILYSGPAYRVLTLDKYARKRLIQYCSRLSKSLTEQYSSIATEKLSRPYFIKAARIKLTPLELALK
jgi:hypothetical protein